MQKLNDKCKEWRNKETIAYSVYGTPMESLTYKFAKTLKNKYNYDKDYITNSYHIPVFEEIDPFEKIKIESKF